MFDAIDTATEKAEHIDFDEVRKEAEQKGEELVVASRGFLQSAPALLGSFWKKHVFSVHRVETLVSKPGSLSNTPEPVGSLPDMKEKSSEPTSKEIIDSFTKRGV